MSSVLSHSPRRSLSPRRWLLPPTPLPAAFACGNLGPLCGSEGRRRGQGQLQREGGFFRRNSGSLGWTWVCVGAVGWLVTTQASCPLEANGPSRPGVK